MLASFEAVKQNLNYAGSSDLLLWGNKLALASYEVVKQNLSYAGSSDLLLWGN